MEDWNGLCPKTIHIHQVGRQACVKCGIPTIKNLMPDQAGGSFGEATQKVYD